MENEAANMNEGGKSIIVDSIAFRQIAGELTKTRPFSSTSIDALQGIDAVERITAKAGATLTEPGNTSMFYWLLLHGKCQADRVEPDGSRTTVGTAQSGEGFGETPFLTGKSHAAFLITAIEDSTLVRFSGEQFWQLMSCCPGARKVILADMAARLSAYQAEALHREKLVSLGTLAAGLMHELHNPGSAAKRAASQLRENMLKLQDLSLRSSKRSKTPEQLDCMHRLLTHAVKGCQCRALSSIEQADEEERLGEWLQESGVENAFNIAPALVSMGFEQEELKCAREFFDAQSFSDTLNWLGALVSSVSLVCSIEESISRISDLAMAVKKFAYDDRSPLKELDVHDSLQSTITILGHKLRVKQITVEKTFEAFPSVIQTRGSALSQVWTNLIDNAADASPAQGRIEIATWTEPATGKANDPGWLAVSVTDHGPGIPANVLPRIFEAFFTTKPQGAGTGLGLEIVHRIVTQKFGGKIDVKSEPGNTRFEVRLPMKGIASVNGK
ncbi:ATP-binding protein [Occallatibacter savannae]|uniref:ATP-binding protein n=1 Tax=Occallatibacter savannae TaxID=1002691 RepID=UPI000D693E4E|nr:ATP-binding protein [Occallatibacter savannae]